MSTESELEHEYEYNARDALRMAENSTSEKDKASWLRIAQMWRRRLKAREHREQSSLNA